MSRTTCAATFMRMGLALLGVAAVTACGGDAMSSADPDSGSGGHDTGPYAAPSRDDVLNSPKKVFVHYVFSPLQSAQTDYWPNNTCMYYLIPANTPPSAGNQRLCPFPPITSGSAPSYIIDNLKSEIEAMIARGVNGVALDLFSVCDWSESGAGCPGNPGSGGPAGYPGALINLINAAAAVDGRFKILPMPDMTAGIKPSDLPGLWTATIGSTTIYDHPNIYRWPDANNYPELSPFCTECFPAAQYSAAFATMMANHTPISWAPVFGSLGCNGSLDGCIFSPYTSLPTVSIGGVGGVITDPSNVTLSLSNIGGPAGGTVYGGGAPIHWTGPVRMFGGMSPQAYQSASGTLYESQNSLAYRAAWEAEIALGETLGNVMIFTWNDYGESTAIEPSQNQYGGFSRGYYDLTGYYTTWWRTGAAPAITHDAILYFYRRQTYSAAHNATIAGLTKPPTLSGGSSAAHDQIEMVALVTPADAAAGAVLQIDVDGNTYTKPSVAGLNSFTVPLPAAASTPAFSITVGGTTRVQLAGIPTYGSSQIPAQEVPNVQCGNPLGSRPCFPAGIPDPVYYSNSTF